MSGKKLKKETPKKAVSKKSAKKNLKPVDARRAMETIDTSVEAIESLFFPDAGAVSTDNDADQKAENQPLPPAMAAKPQDQKSQAEWAYERIILYIQKFEEQLDGDHEVVMGFVGGGVGSMHVQGMGFFAPDLVTFYGVDQGGVKTQMVQHVSQLNVTLKATKKQNKKADPTRIGFLLEKELAKKKPTRAKGRSDKRKKPV